MAAQLSTKIKKYCQANSVSTDSFSFFTDSVTLQDDGSGPYIKEWNLAIAKPTDAQLATYETAADLEERQNAVRATRRSEYKSIADQLDMQYKDEVNSTTTWKDHVEGVKNDNPIPTS